MAAVDNALVDRFGGADGDSACAKPSRSRPCLWVDIRPDDHQAASLILLVGNSGPAVATDFVVTPSLTHVRAVGLVTSACAWSVAPMSAHLNDPT